MKRNAALRKTSPKRLAIFDLLTKPEMNLSAKETQEVKKVARDLLTTLKREKLSLDWRKKQQARAAVQVAIRDIMEGLPPCYTKEIFERKRGKVYEHVFESYSGPGQSIYDKMG